MHCMRYESAYSLPSHIPTRRTSALRKGVFQRLIITNSTPSASERTCLRASLGSDFELLAVFLERSEPVPSRSKCPADNDVAPDVKDSVS